MPCILCVARVISIVFQDALPRTFPNAHSRYDGHQALLNARRFSAQRHLRFRQSHGRLIPLSTPLTPSDSPVDETYLHLRDDGTRGSSLAVIPYKAPSVNHETSTVSSLAQDIYGPLVSEPFGGISGVEARLDTQSNKGLRKELALANQSSLSSAIDTLPDRVRHEQSPSTALQTAPSNGDVDANDRAAFVDLTSETVDALATELAEIRSRKAQLKANWRAKRKAKRREEGKARYIAEGGLTWKQKQRAQVLAKLREKWRAQRCRSKERRRMEATEEAESPFSMPWSKELLRMEATEEAGSSFSMPQQSGDASAEKPPPGKNARKRARRKAEQEAKLAAEREAHPQVEHTTEMPSREAKVTAQQSCQMPEQPNEAPVRETPVGANAGRRARRVAEQDADPGPVQKTEPRSHLRAQPSTISGRIAPTGKEPKFISPTLGANISSPTQPTKQKKPGKQAQDVVATADKEEQKPPATKVRPFDRRPLAEIQPWEIQKAALQNKFAEGWNPRKKLSPDTMDGIRALHKQDPKKYTTPVLAKQFEVSPEAIRRILKSKWQPTAEEAEKRKQRWEKRGEKIWTQKAQMGIKPPKKWRRMGVANAVDFKPSVKKARLPVGRIGSYPKRNEKPRKREASDRSGKSRKEQQRVGDALDVLFDVQERRDGPRISGRIL